MARPKLQPHSGPLPQGGGEQDYILRRPDMSRLANVSIDSIKRWEREGIAPPPVAIGPRLKGQWRSVWLAWLAGRNAGRAA